jgi:hypothetical protein
MKLYVEFECAGCGDMHRVALNTETEEIVKVKCKCGHTGGLETFHSPEPTDEAPMYLYVQEDFMEDFMSEQFQGTRH